MRYFVYCFLYAFPCLCFAQAELSDFTASPDFQHVQISPDGEHLAFTKSEGDVDHLLVVKTEDLTGISNTSFGRNIGISEFRWVNNNRLLISYDHSFFGRLDYKAPTVEIFGIDADGRNLDTLFGFSAHAATIGGTRVRNRETIQAAGIIIDYIPEDPDWVVVQSQGYGEKNSAYRMRVTDGSLRKLADSPIHNGMFSTGLNHEVRFVEGANEANEEVIYLSTDDGDWELIGTSAEGTYFSPLMPSPDGRGMYVTSVSDKGTDRLALWDYDNRSLTELFTSNSGDFSKYYRDFTNNLWALRFEGHFPEYYYPDPTHPLVELHQSLRQQFQGLDVELVDSSLDEEKIVLFVSSPRFPGEYLILDVAEGQFLYRMPMYPEMQTRQLAKVDPIVFNSRDGLEVRGFLTLPPGVPEQNLPMVVMVHGGPHGVYDRWQYNYEAQMLAANGYLVLQVNYRGSGGRENWFEAAGYGEWGMKMQDDVTDGVHWALEEGLADRGRICIYGTSYGGYSALTGAYKEPDLFQCAVGLAGIYDLEMLYERGDIQTVEQGVSYLLEVIGNDAAELRRRSPVYHADQITANVMLVHGRLDERVPIEHAERMREALEGAGNPPVWLVERGDSHGIFGSENRQQVYQAILDFLDDNIGN